jgi:magnesium chelatase family protein
MVARSTGPDDLPLIIVPHRGPAVAPLLDRIDIRIDVPAVKFRELASDVPAESSSAIRARVVRASRVQLERFHGENIFCNAQMTPRLIRKVCKWTRRRTLCSRTRSRGWAYLPLHIDRILKVSRTPADLEWKENIEPGHVSEAIQYRTFDRNFWT